MDLQQLCNYSSVEGMRLVVRNNELKAVKKEEITWTECARAKLGLGGAASMKNVAQYVLDHNQEVFKSDNDEAMMKFFKKFKDSCEKYNATRWLSLNKVDSRTQKINSTDALFYLKAWETESKSPSQKHKGMYVQDLATAKVAEPKKTPYTKAMSRPSIACLDLDAGKHARVRKGITVNYTLGNKMYQHQVGVDLKYTRALDDIRNSKKEKKHASELAKYRAIYSAKPVAPKQGLAATISGAVSGRFKKK